MPARFIAIGMPIANVATDFYILALPINPVMRLNLSRREKLGVLALLLAGLLYDVSNLSF